MAENPGLVLEVGSFPMVGFESARFVSYLYQALDDPILGEVLSGSVHYNRLMGYLAEVDFIPMEAYDKPEILKEIIGVSLDIVGWVNSLDIGLSEDLAFDKMVNIQRVIILIGVGEKVFMKALVMNRRMVVDILQELNIENYMNQGIVVAAYHKFIVAARGLSEATSRLPELRDHTMLRAA